MHTKLAILALALLVFASSVSAWGFFYTDTWNSNQVLIGAYTRPSAYGSWVYPQYQHVGYPTIGGGRIYAYPSYGYGFGYGAGYGVYSPSYAGHYVGGYTGYGAPIHTTTPTVQCNTYYGC